MFFKCVSTNDPMAVAVILKKQPFHIDSLISLANVCVKSNDQPTAVDLLVNIHFYYDNCFFFKLYFFEIVQMYFF